MGRWHARPGVRETMRWRVRHASLGALVALGMNVSQAGAAGSGRWDGLADPVFRHVDQNDVLANILLPVVMAEDATGFLWIGGEDGLSRWDGYRSHNLGGDQSAPDGLRDQDVKALHRDAGGRLWAGTMAGGLARYEAALGRFIPVPLGVDADAPVTGLDDDGAGGLWVASHAGLFHLNTFGKVVAHLLHSPGQPDSLPDNNVLSVLRDQQGTIWAGTARGLARGVDNEGHFVTVPLPVAGGDAAEVSHLFQDSWRRIWVGTRRQGAYVISADRGAARSISMTARGPGEQDATSEIYAITEVVAGRVWLGTFGHGIVEVDGHDLRMHRIVRNPTLPGSLESDTIYSLYRDRSGIVWVGTDLGLSQYMASSGAFVTVFGRRGQVSGLPDANVLAVMAQADGSVWAGLKDGGIAIADPVTGRVAKLNVPRVFAMARSPTGGVLVGTSGGLFLADPSGHGSVKLEIPNRAAKSAVYALCPLDGAIWLGGGDDGLWELLLGKDDKVAVLRHEDTPRLTNSAIYAISPGPDGILALGTDDGFNLLDRGSGAIERIFPDPADPTGFSAGHVDSFARDRHGRLWIGTTSSGIYVMLGRDGAGRPRFRHLRLADGLPNTDANQMVVDQTGLVWVSTDNGLAVIDPDTFAVRAFRRADGLPITQYWSMSGASTPQGEIIFGGIGGLTVVRPELIADWHYEPPVVVTEVKAGGKSVPGDFDAANTLLDVSPDADSLSVEFSALDYSEPQLNRYRYRLEGYDTAWVETDAAHRVASYTNLPPGNYRLRLSGSNRNGVWTRQEAGLRIHVRPAWYQTVWFRLVQAGLALSVLAAAVQGRTAVLRRRQRELERQVDGRTAELLARTEALSESRQQLHQYAYIDTLTALPNRRAFNEMFRRMMETAVMSSVGFALVLVDLDGFKQVNDTLGHDAGDELLVIAAGRMAAALREGDFVARLGGDEFALLLGEVREEGVVNLICDRLIASMTKPMTIKSTCVMIGASAGAARFPQHGRTQDDLYRLTDLALYESKRAGKGSWRWFCSDAVPEPTTAAR